MGPLDLLYHLLNFIAPALFTGVVVALLARRVGRPGPHAPTFWRQAGWNAGAGVLALLAGLVVFGRDGKMATYAALAVAVATSQWVLQRSWRA